MANELCVILSASYELRLSTSRLSCATYVRLYQRRGSLPGRDQLALIDDRAKNGISQRFITRPTERTMF